MSCICATELSKPAAGPAPLAQHWLLGPLPLALIRPPAPLPFSRASFQSLLIHWLSLEFRGLLSLPVCRLHRLYPRRFPLRSALGISLKAFSETRTRASLWVKPQIWTPEGGASDEPAQLEPQLSCGPEPLLPPSAKFSTLNSKPKSLPLTRDYTTLGPSFPAKLWTSKDAASASTRAGRTCALLAS